jgi:hypothetical protein
MLVAPTTLSETNIDSNDFVALATGLIIIYRGLVGLLIMFC